MEICKHNHKIIKINRNTIESFFTVRVLNVVYICGPNSAVQNAGGRFSI